MGAQERILAFSGSARSGSWNQRILKIAIAGARDAGAHVNECDLRALDLPIYDGDYEEQEGMPEQARFFKQLLCEHDGLIIACPEYNSSITPLLKNAIDWASRQEDGETPLIAFRGKIAGLVSASPGQWGGLRAATHLRALLHNIGVTVVTGSVHVSRIGEASFAPDGEMHDEDLQRRLHACGRMVTESIRRLKGNLVMH